MKNYTITVNGTAYDVTVEESGKSSGNVQAPVQAAPAPKAAAPKASGSKGSLEITAGASGKVFRIDTKPGDAVKPGDPVLTLEVMKMETPVVAPKAGTVASIEVSEGQMVNAGDLLATMNE